MSRCHVMPPFRHPEPAMPVEPHDTPAAIVDEYLRALMISVPRAAMRFVAPELRIRFTSGRAVRAPAECAAFKATRYRRVKKPVDATETVAGGCTRQHRPLRPLPRAGGGQAL
jgi:hypothetical protein